MNIKLMVGFLLMGCGIWGAQIDPQISQALQQEIQQNRANMVAGLQMLQQGHNIVINDCKSGHITGIGQAVKDSKHVIGQFNGNRSVKCSHFCENNKTLYCFHQGEWLTYDFDSCDQMAPNEEVIIFNIFPVREDQSAAGNLIVTSCKSIKRFTGLGKRILINTDARTDVEKALESFFDKTSWARVSESKIVPPKKSAYSFKAQVILGGSIAALVAFLCYLRWGR